MYQQDRPSLPHKAHVFMLFMFLIMQAVNFAFAAEDKMLVLDASGSMWGQIDGKTKIEIARDVLKKVLKDWPADTGAGLITYGHRKKGNCSDIEVVLPVGPLDIRQLGRVVDNITPRGKTPLSAAVRLGANELKFSEQEATVVLISDGKETCDNDPCALGLELERLGVNFTSHVIGFDVKSEDDQQGLRCLAKNTGGDYFSVSTEDELEDAVKRATNIEKSANYPAVALHAPIEVKTGAEFAVDILAKDGLDGRVKMYAPGNPEAIAWQRIQKSKDRGYKAALLQAPEVAGEYILKFMTPDDTRELARRAIQVVDAGIKLIADNAALISSTIDVTLKAAPNHEGRIALYRKGQSQPYSYLPISTDSEGLYETVTLNTPSRSGQYVLRMENPQNEVLAEKPLSVEPADIVIDSAKTAAIATRLKVFLLAPPGLQGRLQLHPEGQNIALDTQAVGAATDTAYKPVDFQLPALAGDYEIRFVSLSNELLAKSRVTAIKTEISLTTPAKANAREIVVVTPFGPKGLMGKVRLETADGTVVDEAQNIEPIIEAEYKPLGFKIPNRGGAYFFRFYTLRGELILQRQITVAD